MKDIIERLEGKYGKRSPLSLKNGEIGGFLEEEKEEMVREDFRRIYEYYEKGGQILGRKKMLEDWIRENEVILLHNERVKKDNRNLPLEKEFLELLELRRYSRRTIKAYKNALLLANGYMTQKEGLTIAEADKEQIQRYFQNLTDREISISSVRIARFAIEYYLNEILLKPIRLDFAYGLRKKEHLPTIFSKWEVLKILSVSTNLKHKLILSLLYSAGLRLSEVIHLKVKDIDLVDKTIRVREGKGGKDRVTVLSEKLIADLTIFIRNRKPTDILFPSNQKSESGKERHLSARTVEKIFQNTLLKSGIKKHGTPHDFRHSFATHLLETGTDIHFIQKLLGHKNLSTTTIYTRLANPKIAGVRSPL